MLHMAIKNILVPFDFSADAGNAYREAEKIADLFGASIRLVHAVNPSVSAVREDFLMNAFPLTNLDEYLEDLENGMYEFLEKNNQHSGLGHCKARLGSWLKVLQDDAVEFPADLAVVGHRAGGVLAGMINNLAPLDIIRDMRIPVLTVTRAFPHVGFSNMLLPIRNVSNWYDKVPFVATMAQQTGSLVHIVGLDTSDDPSVKARIRSNIDYITANFDKDNIRYTVKSLYNAPIVHSLKQYALQKRADMIALTPDTNFRLSNLFEPRFFNRFLSETPAPVVGVRFA